MIRHILAVVRQSRKTQVLGALFLACIALVALFNILVAVPAAGRVSDVRARLDSIDAELATVERQVARYDGFMAGRGDVEMFKQMLPAREDYVGLLEKVYAMAKKDGVAGPSFGASTSAITKSSGLDQVSFSLPASGSYTEVRRFIYDIETSDLFLTINSLGLSKSAEDEISLSIGLTTYVR